jgi:hypothetical protein
VEPDLISACLQAVIKMTKTKTIALVAIGSKIIKLYSLSHVAGNCH